MLESLYLPIFPTGSLASSVVTTVWLGMFVVVFFNLRFGWVLSGLVVPGYLVPLLIEKPWSCGVIIFEACLTYLLVYIFSERASRFGKWSSLFGRDRFFALVLMSAVVRVICDGFVFPAFADWLMQATGERLELANELRSFGLIIVALIANQFWKPGLLRGMFMLTVLLGITWLLTRFVLMPWTNFSMSNVGFLYEDLAQSILASPKAYIVLITAAFLASRFNLLYGWDFNGILLPSLLALQWYQPSKILFTFVEAYFILLLARALMGSTLFANMNIEGSRKLLLFFNISFAYRFVLGHALSAWAPEYKISDAYGFGYLLATLLAIKMYDKGMAIQITRATLQASISALVIASLVGFGLLQLPSARPVPAQAQASVAPQMQTKQPTALAALQARNVQPLQVALADMNLPQTQSALTQWHTAIAPLAVLQSTEQRAVLDDVSNKLAAIGMRMLVIQQRYLLIEEIDPGQGRGLFLIDTHSQNNLLLSWPDMSASNQPMELAWPWFRTTNARAMALTTRGHSLVQSDAQIRSFEAAQSYHRAFANALALNQRLELAVDATHSARLQIQNNWPASLPLADLQEKLPALNTQWLPPDAPDIAVARLSLSAQSLQRHYLDTAQRYSAANTTHISQRIDSHLGRHLLIDTPQRFSSAGSGDYAPPTQAELLFAEQRLIKPLLALAPKVARVQDAAAELEQLRGHAAALDLDIRTLQQTGSGTQWLIVEEPPAQARHFRGVWVVRLGDARNILLQVPFPQSESGTAEFGLALLASLNARAMFISTAHRAARLDGAADPLIREHRHSLFNAVHQAWLSLDPQAPVLTVQLRGLAATSVRSDPAPDLAVVSPMLPSGPLVTELAHDLQQLDLRTTWAHLDDLSTPGASGNLQAEFSQLYGGAEFSVLRLSRELRQAFRRYSLKKLEASQFHALNLPSHEIDLSTYIADQRLSWNGPPADIKRRIRRYQRNQDIMSLYLLINSWPNHRFVRLLDPGLAQSFMAVHKPDGELLGVVNLSPVHRAAQLSHTATDKLFDSVSQFNNQGAAWLVFKPAP